MSITTVLFDLDGTLLPMDQEEFTSGYFELLAGKMSAYGYEKQQLVDAVWKGTAAMVKNADKYNADVTRFSVIGHSAGGFIAAKAAIALDAKGFQLESQILLCPWTTGLPNTVRTGSFTACPATVQSLTRARTARTTLCPR